MTALAEPIASPALGEQGTQEEEIRLLALTEVKPAKDNPRRSVGDVAELAASISAVGLIEPLIVTPERKGYLLVCGARRHAAAKEAGLTHVPCIVRAFDERGRQEAMLVENLQREDLAPLEEASAYKRLVELGLSQRELAARVGRSQGHVSKRLALLELPEKVQAKVDSGGITLEDAQELLKLKDMPKRLDAAWKASNGGHWITSAVSQQLEEHKQETKIGQARERLKKAGVRQVELVKDRYQQFDLPAGARVIQKGGGYTNLGRGDALNIDPKTHAKEDCHGAAVLRGWNAGEVVYVCTKPANHPEATKKASRGKTDQKSTKYRAHEKALKEVAARRRAFVAEQVGARHAKAEILQLVVDALVEAARGDAAAIALDLLGLEPIVKRNSWGGTDKDRYTPLHNLADQSERDRIRVGLALAFAEREWCIGGVWGAFHGDLQPYFDFLAAHGYEISDAEKLELAGKAPRPSY